MTVGEILSVKWDAHRVRGLDDLISHRADIMDVTQMYRRFDDIFDSNDYLIMDAVATAAIIRYCRCFTTGVRSTLSINSLPSLTDAERGLHRTLVDTRNRHVAHAINKMETQNVFIGIGRDHDGKGLVTSVHTGTRSQTAVGREQAREALALCMRWYQHLSAQVAAATDEICIRARNLTSAELLALPRGPLSPDLEPTKRRSVTR